MLLGLVIRTHSTLDMLVVLRGIHEDTLVTEQPCNRLGNVPDVAGVERQLARSQEMWEFEYNIFIAELSTFVNKEISEFRHSVLSVGESTAQLQGTA